MALRALCVQLSFEKKKASENQLPLDRRCGAATRSVEKFKEGHYVPKRYHGNGKDESF